MSHPRDPVPVKIFLSALYRDPAALSAALEKFSAEFGLSDYSTRALHFKETGYYIREMGTPLFRRFFTFRRLIDPGRLVDIKFFTNRLEEEAGSPRVINLDPGILTMGNLVLASGKNVGHRVYLGRGMYAELTLIYQCGTFIATPWTYPDYAVPEMVGFLNRIRESYKIDLRELKDEQERMHYRETAMHREEEEFDD